MPILSPPILKIEPQILYVKLENPNIVPNLNPAPYPPRGTHGTLLKLCYNRSIMPFQQATKVITSIAILAL